MDNSLNEAVEAFSKWRSNRTSKVERIPSELKDMVKSLFPTQGATVLRRELGLTLQQLRNMGLPVDNKPTAEKKSNMPKEVTNFAQVNVALPSPTVEIVLQKGCNTLTVKLPTNALQTSLAMVVNSL